MKKCPKCYKEMFDNVNICPRCETPYFEPPPKTSISGLSILLIVLGILQLAGSVYQAGLMLGSEYPSDTMVQSAFYTLISGTCSAVLFIAVSLILNTVRQLQKSLNELTKKGAPSMSETRQMSET